MRNTILFILTIFMMPACQKDSIMTYDTSDHIYFDFRRDVKPAQNQPGYPVDSLVYTFAYTDASVKETIIPIPVTVMGKPASEDRNYQLIVDAGASAQQGKHYEMSATVIHAGKLKDTLFLTLKRTADLQQSTVQMTLRLQPNQHFGTGVEKRLSLGDTIPALAFRISVTDELSQGPAWSQYAVFFGTFSKKKVLLMHDIVDLPLDFWASATFSSEAKSSATYYAAAMSRYLKEAALAGNTIYDEDGTTPMKMGADYQ